MFRSLNIKRLIWTGNLQALVDAANAGDLMAYEALKKSVENLQLRKDLHGLVTLLRCTEYLVYAGAEDALKSVSDTHKIDVLGGALADAHDRVRRTAAFLLGETRDKRAAEALAAALDTKAEDRTQTNSILFALSKIPDSRAVPKALVLLEHDDDEICCGAAHLLAAIRAPETVEPLTRALKRPGSIVKHVDATRSVSYPLRAQIATYLGSFGHPGAIDPLLDLLGDSEEHTRKAAVDALNELATGLAATDPATASSVRERVSRRLAQDPPPTDLATVGELISKRQWEKAATFGAVTGVVEPVFKAFDKAKANVTWFGPIRALVALRGTGYRLRATQALTARVVRPLMASFGDWGTEFARTYRDTFRDPNLCRVCDQRFPGRSSFEKTPAMWEGGCVVPQVSFRTIAALGYDPFTRGRLKPLARQVRLLEEAALLGDKRIQEGAAKMLRPAVERGVNLTPAQLVDEWREGVLDPRGPAMLDIPVLCGICAKDVQEFLRDYEL